MPFFKENSGKKSRNKVPNVNISLQEYASNKEKKIKKSTKPKEKSFSSVFGSLLLLFAQLFRSLFFTILGVLVGFFLRMAFEGMMLFFGS